MALQLLSVRKHEQRSEEAFPWHSEHVKTGMFISLSVVHNTMWLHVCVDGILRDAASAT